MKRELSPALRKRLPKVFEAGQKQESQGKFDYASELYTECVRGDPGNLEYLQSFMTNLHKMYGSVKKLGPMVQFKERGARAAMKKAIAQCDWDEAIQQGISVLLANPWDVPTLTAMAKACSGVLTQEGASAAVTYGDCELFYLKCAFDTFPRDKPDAEVCRQLAEALTLRERFVEAVNFWHRVELVRPDWDLPKRSIATITVLQHQVKDPKYEADRKVTSKPGAGKQEEFTHEDRLKQRIQRNPKDLSGYDELGNLYLNTDRFVEAEEVFKQKLEASNNDPTVREEIEDVQLRALRSKMTAAHRKAKETGKEADKKEYERQRMTVIEKELQVYRNRCERYPNNLIFHYELAQRHQLKGDLGEAIKEYQIAKNDPRKRGMCLINLGECFRAIKQFHLAMNHFEQAVQEIPDREQEYKKLAYYRAGKLAMGLKDLAKAEKYLTTLASIDYTFRDASDLLERLHRMMEEQNEPGDGQGKREEKKKKNEDDEENEESGEE
ncbi:MAG: tetratricopeptide repeat protein [Thermoguttaceae bacterium]